MIFPAQCSCGHIFLEHFITPDGKGFSWCGFCRTRADVKEQGIDWTKDNIYDAIGRPDLKPIIKELKEQLHE